MHQTASVTLAERNGQWTVETIEDGKVTFRGHYTNKPEAERGRRAEEERLAAKKPPPRR